jgi:hypothetical protein
MALYLEVMKEGGQAELKNNGLRGSMPSENFQNPCFEVK